MNSKRAWWVLGAVTPSLVCASEHSQGINWWHLGAAYKDAPALGWLFLTFLIFVYGLMRAIKKPLGLYLETRSHDIKKQLEEAKIAKEQSEKKLLEYEEKLRLLDHEIDSMKAHFTEQAMAEQKERERIRHELEQRIIREADDSIKANYEREKNRLTEEVLEKALKIAEQLIKDNKRDAVDGALRMAFVKDIEVAAKDVRHDV